jgi:type IV secretion system protein VirB11
MSQATAALLPLEGRSLRIEKMTRELGPIIRKLLGEPKVSDILVNSDRKIWVEKLGEPMQCVGEMPASQAEALIGTLAAYHDTVVTSEKAILECILPINGARVEAIFPPVVASPVLSIRLRASSVFTLSQYVEASIMSQAQKELLEEAIGSRKNILIVGSTGSGKTTLTNGMIDKMVEINPEHRLVIIEDTPEIQCAAENVVILNTTDHETMLSLLRATMRLRPDRILVGEVRGPEALALLKCWNTGHPGGIATIHANNAKAGLIRLEQLIAEASVTPMQSLIAEAVDLIVFIEKTPTGRKVQEIIQVKGFENGHYVFE